MSPVPKTDLVGRKIKVIRSNSRMWYAGYVGNVYTVGQYRDEWAGKSVSGFEISDGPSLGTTTGGFVREQDCILLPKKRNRIIEAASDNLPPCPKCSALRGDPCRKPNGHTTTPHLERIQKRAMEVEREIEETYGT